MSESQAKEKVIEDSKEVEKIKFQVGASAVPMLVDFSLRLTVLYLYRVEAISAAVFWLLQLAGLTFISFLFASLVYGPKQEKQIRDSNNLAVDTLVVIEPDNRIPLMSLLTLLGVYLGYGAMTVNIWIKIIFTIVMFMLYAGFLFALLLESPQSVKKSDILRSRGDELSTDFQKYLDKRMQLSVEERTDENDKIIIQSEIKSRTLSAQVETYTIESILFGGLSFSAFTSILSSSSTMHFELGALWKDMSTLNASGVPETFGEYFVRFVALLTPEKITPLIGICALTCSLFFLLAIVVRSRYFSLVSRLDEENSTARALNIKEEEVFKVRLQAPMKQKPRLLTRLNALSKKIAQSTYWSDIVLAELSPVVSYMGLFRDLGIGMFIITITLSAYLVDISLAIGFVVIISGVFLSGRLIVAIKNARLEKTTSLTGS